MFQIFLPRSENGYVITYKNDSNFLAENNIENAINTINNNN